LAKVARRLHAGRPFAIGLNLWYLLPDGPSRGVLKVRHGVIEEIGIANPQLTRTRRGARVFFTSFSWRGKPARQGSDRRRLLGGSQRALDHLLAVLAAGCHAIAPSATWGPTASSADRVWAKRSTPA